METKRLEGLEICKRCGSGSLIRYRVTGVGNVILCGECGFEENLKMTDTGYKLEGALGSREYTFEEVKARRTQPYFFK